MLSPLRCLCVALAMIVSTTIITDFARADLRYSITQLRPVSTAVGKYSTANAINDAGVAVGLETVLGPFSSLDLTQTRALQWTAASQGTALATPAGTIGASAETVSLAGVVRGNAFRSQSDFPGVGALLGGAGSSTINFGTTNAVPLIAGNVHGDVVAGAWSSGLYIAPATGTPTLLNAEGRALFPVAINANRIVVANIYESSDRRPRVMRAGAPPVPVQLSGYGASAWVEAEDINLSDTILAEVSTGLWTRAARVNASTGHAQFLDSIVSFVTDDRAFVTAMNDRGVVVGLSGTFSQGFKPVRWDATTPVDLLTKIDGVSRWSNFSLADINNRGQIVGEALFDHDNNAGTSRIRTAFRLDPIRTPGDLDYSGVVDFADLVTLAQNYGRTGNGNVFWESGDFDFDWAVGFSDLVLMAQNYSTPGSFSGDFARAMAMAPEPGSVALLVGTALLALRRSRRA